jgi:Zn-dependent protease with chaperone function
MTYARARLWLGISCVGFLTVTAGVLLANQQSLIAVVPTDGAWQNDILVFASFLAAFVGVSLPFDLLGGYLIPKRFGRPTPSFGRFARTWLRGVVVQSVFLLLFALILLSVGRAFGTAGFIAAAAALMLLIIAYQQRIAQWVGGMRSRRVALPTDAAFQHGVAIAADDPGFVGGWSGLPGRERLVIPGRWLDELSAGELKLQITRRLAVLPQARNTGMALAVAWNLFGLTLATLLPGSAVTSATGVVIIALYMTLWSFVGLLILPSFSRSAVYVADQVAAQQQPALVPALIQRLDHWQEDEPRRHKGVEAIFHPVPAAQHRIAALADDGQDAHFSAYHAARIALPLSWACLGLLGRAVHCNCGKPELWVMLPGD